MIGLARAFPRFTRLKSLRPRISASSPFRQSFLFSSKPDFKQELEAKHFDFQKLEPTIYKWWEATDYFKPVENNDPKKKFIVPMPPPNVTGYLHMGHAIFIALQDIMIRFHRMRGFETLWVPGT
jgi:isoleucyl-tRNA synthetase